MRILIFGGTRFAGSFFAERAIEAGHSVTQFHRGLSHGASLAGVEHLIGDRDSRGAEKRAKQLAALQARLDAGEIDALPEVPPEVPLGLHLLSGRSFDVVVDFSGYLPRVLSESLDALGEVGYYLFISTCSVYSDGETSNLAEDGPLETPPAPDVEEITGDTYGGLKVACERVIQQRVPRHAIVRPGLIVGPRDPTDRFTWWPARVADGGELIAPAPAETCVQGIDARDLADFVLRLVEAGTEGTYNAVGAPTPMGEVLSTCQEHAGSAEVVWADGAWLEAADVKPWMQLPLWVGTDPEHAGWGSRSHAAASAAGLRLRPLSETVRDTLAWWRETGRTRDSMPTGLPAEREAELIRRWRQR